jgi:hypothetical protein
MLPNISMLSVNLNVMTLPPEILAHILTAYSNGNIEVICNMVSSLCNASRCPVEVWDAVLVFIRSNLNTIDKNGASVQRWQGPDIPDPLPVNLTSEGFVRQTCKIIRACTNGYVHGGIVQITRSLFDSKNEFMIPFMIQRLHYNKLSQITEERFKEERELLKDSNYVNCLPFKREQRDGMFRGFKDFYHDPHPIDIPDKGIWTDDTTGKQYGILRDGQHYYYTDQTYDNREDIRNPNINIEDKGIWHSEYDDKANSAPAIRLGHMDRRLTSRQFKDLLKRLYWIANMDSQYACFREVLDHARFGGRDHDDDPEDDDDNIPLKIFPYVQKTKNMIRLIRGMGFLHSDLHDPTYNYVFNGEFFDHIDYDREGEHQEFLYRAATDAELTMLYIMFVEQVPQIVSGDLYDPNDESRYF